MDPAFWVCVYLPIIIAIAMALNDRNHMMQIIKKRINLKNGGVSVMNELIKNYIGKSCIFYNFNSSSVTGVIESSENNWVTLKTSKGVQIINLDFVCRIRLA